jgi:hypothetical protein
VLKSGRLRFVGSNPATGANFKTNKMKNRVKLLGFSELTQATLLKLVNDKDKDCIKVSVYGYTTGSDHIEFSYDLEFPDEEKRDSTFDEITAELMFEDIKKIISNSSISILI